MKFKLRLALSILQFPILFFSRILFKIFVNSPSYSFVIGVTEVAKMLHSYKYIFPNSMTVCLDKNKYYNLNYDFYINKSSGSLNLVKYLFIRFFYGPILLGYLMSRSEVFVYNWRNGFLIDRGLEFYFLKKSGKKIVTIFNGSDIRSPKLFKRFCEEQSLDCYFDYSESKSNKYISSIDKLAKYNAYISDRYSSVTFSWRFDQFSYLRSIQYTPPFLCKNEFFNFNSEKFRDCNKLKVLHAPSNPNVKGTALVRAAIKKLKTEGYDFDYVEVLNKSNSDVLSELKDSHIVLNQFYLLQPGVFGIEAMANHCAVLMSADPLIETSLPCSASDAWLVTHYWQIYDNLKFLLDNTSRIEEIATNGYFFAKNNYELAKVKAYVKHVLLEHGINCA